MVIYHGAPDGNFFNLTRWGLETIGPPYLTNLPSTQDIRRYAFTLASFEE
jgi:hypothetical protein